MAIAERDVRFLEADHPGIAILARQQGFLRSLQERVTGRSGPDVAAVRASVSGVRGAGLTDRIDYELVVDVSRLGKRLPTVWVTAPDDTRIRHVNIFRAERPDGLCPWLGVRLPYLCWFSYENPWSAAPARHRTLGAVLEYVRQLLNRENHDSPAR